MVIKVYNLTPECQTNADGLKVFQVIAPMLKKGELVELSFENIRSIPSSFVNTAFIDLLEIISFDQIRKQLKFLNTTPQINDVIKTRFATELTRQKQ